MASTIVVGHSGITEESHPALRVAAEAARAYGDELVIVFGYDPPKTGGEVGELRRSLAELGRDLLDEAAAEIEALGPELVVRTELVEGRPVESLLTVAQARSARMIVVGHGGRSPVTGGILGSVAYSLVHQSTVPVLVVPQE